MLAVMGGRLSEGVNFSDRLARAVIVVGQPFPNILDAETRERSNHYARLRGDQSAIQEYLENLCMRSVNQTIGIL
jgi:chromosome transmission fidelity protein 1